MTELNKNQLDLAENLFAALGMDGVSKLREVLAGDVVQGGSGSGRGHVERDRDQSRDIPELPDLGSSVPGVDVGDLTSVSSTSWSDMVEEDQVPVVGVPSAAADVKSRVVFGGFGDGAVVSAVGSDKGGMSQYVRTPLAKGMRAELAALGVRMPKQSAYMLALCTHTAATMPAFFKCGKDKLKTIAVLGDAAMVAAVAKDALKIGASLESVQRLRDTNLTDAHLAPAFAASKFSTCVSVGGGVSLAHAKTGATALEAVVGLVSYYCSPDDVAAVVRGFGLM